MVIYGTFPFFEIVKRKLITANKRESLIIVFKIRIEQRITPNKTNKRKCTNHMNMHEYRKRFFAWTDQRKVTNIIYVIPSNVSVGNKC